jgi:hypothetical protein
MDVGERIPPETLDKIVAGLMAAPAMRFVESAPVPASPGIYAFFTKEGCLYAGDSKNLGRRILDQHWNGNASRDLKQMVQDNHCAVGGAAAHECMKANCVFKWIEVPDATMRYFAQLTLITHLQPRWGGKR